MSGFGGLEEKIMMESMLRKKLMEEIASLKQSEHHLSKDIELARREYASHNKRLNRYKEVSYLSKSVQQQTEHIMHGNSRDYRQMVRKQGDTIANLKNYRYYLKRENQELETKYLRGNREKMKRPLTCNHKNVKGKNKTDSDDFRMQHLCALNRHHFRFMEYVGRVLSILEKNESSYESLKPN